MPKDKSVLEEVFSRSNHMATPVLLKFQNGVLKNTHKDKTLYFPAECEEDKKIHAVVVAADNIYTGVIGDEQTTELTDTYICIRNKTTNKVRMIAIDQASLTNNIYQEKEKPKSTELSKDDLYSKLMRNFGGKKAMQKISNKEKNDLSVDIIKDQLATTVEKSEINETNEPIVSTDEIVDRLRPKFNKDATTLPNVFNIYDVIPLELIDRLSEEADFLFTIESSQIPIQSEYLQKAIKSLKKNPISSQSLLKMKMIIYMDGLITLLKAKRMSLKKMELSKVTEKVENDIRQRFSDQNDFRQLKSNFSTEKALCYFLVLTFLISDNFEVDLSVLSQEIAMSKAKILKYGHLINATLKARSDSLALRLPSSVRPMSFAFLGKRRKL